MEKGFCMICGLRMRFFGIVVMFTSDHIAGFTAPETTRKHVDAEYSSELTATRQSDDVVVKISSGVRW